MVASNDRQTRRAPSASAAGVPRSDRPYRLTARDTASSPAPMKDFDTAEGAFYFAQRDPNFKTAELSKDGHRICELRRSHLGSASVWQVIPIESHSIDEVETAPQVSRQRDPARHRTPDPA